MTSAYSVLKLLCSKLRFCKYLFDTYHPKMSIDVEQTYQRAIFDWFSQKYFSRLLMFQFPPEDSSQKGTGSKRCELQSCLILFASCVTLSIQLFTALPHWWQVGPTWLPAVGVLPIAPNRTEERTRSVKVLRQFCNSQRLLPVPFWLESSAEEMSGMGKNSVLRRE